MRHAMRKPIYKHRSTGRVKEILIITYTVVVVVVVVCRKCIIRRYTVGKKLSIFDFDC